MKKLLKNSSILPRQGPRRKLCLGTLAFAPLVLPACSPLIDRWSNQYVSKKGFLSSTTMESEITECHATTDKAQGEKKVEAFQMSEFMRNCMREKGYRSHAL